MKSLIAVFAAMLVSAAVAQGEDASPKRERARSIEPVVRAALNPKIAEKIGVTEEQAAKLKALKAGQEGQKELNEKIRKGMERQAELLKAEQVDEVAVMAAIDEVWEARKEIAKRQTKRIIAVKSILTPEQIAKARDAVKSIRREGGRKSGRKGKPGKAPAEVEAK